MEVFSASDVGKVRENNEDYILIVKEKDVFVVCDGMGGHEAGDIASKLAASKIKEEIEKMDDFLFERDIEAVLRKANDYILEYAIANIKSSNMGTTVVICKITGNELSLANVGDSRLYILNQENIHQVSKDHSLVAELVKIGSITPKEADTHPDKNIITSALGINDVFDIYQNKVDLEGQKYVLLCSDGLTNMVSPEKIHEVFYHLPIDEVPKALIDLANENGGTDNISVVCIEL